MLLMILHGKTIVFFFFVSPWNPVPRGTRARPPVEPGPTVRRLRGRIIFSLSLSLPLCPAPSWLKVPSWLKQVKASHLGRERTGGLAAWNQYAQHGVAGYV